MWVVVAYKVGDSDGFEDGTNHVFGWNGKPFESEEDANDWAVSLDPEKWWNAEALKISEHPNR